MRSIWGVTGPEAIVEAVSTAYGILFEAKGTPLHRAMARAVDQAKSMGDSVDAAGVLVGNLRDLVNAHLWGKDDGAVDCRKPFIRFYEFLVPIFKERFHADSGSFDLPAASRFMERLAGMQDSISGDGSTGLTYNGSALTYDAVMNAGLSRKAGTLPGDRALPATRGEYRVTYIDSRETLMSKDLYRYTGWCICDSSRNKFDEYNGTYGSNTCYLVSRDGFESIEKDSPDYPASLICLFVDVNGRLAYAFNRVNDMISERGITEVLGYPMDEACPPRISISKDNMCVKLAALEYAAGGIDPANALEDAGYRVEEIYSTPNSRYGVTQYLVSDNKSANVLLRFDTGSGNPGNYRLMFDGWDSNEVGFAPRYDGTMFTGRTIYDYKGDELESLSDGSFSNDLECDRSGLLVVRDSNYNIVNLYDLVCHDEVFSGPVDIKSVSGSSRDYICISMRHGVDFILDCNEINGQIDVGMMPNPAKVPAGYGLTDISDPAMIQIPMTEVVTRRNDRVQSNFIDNSGRIILPEDYDEVDAMNIEDGAIYMELASKTADGGYDCASYNIRLDTMEATLIEKWHDGPNS